MPRRRTNSVKLTIRLSPEDVARLDDLCLPDEPRSTAAARLLRRILRHPEPIDEILDTLRRIERRLNGVPAPAPEPPKDPTPLAPAPEPLSDHGEARQEKLEETAPNAGAAKSNGNRSPKRDLGLTGILEGFDLH